MYKIRPKVSGFLFPVWYLNDSGNGELETGNLSWYKVPQ